MKRATSIILFIVLAGIVLWIGKWYTDKLSLESHNAEVAQGVAAEQTQAQIMEKLKIEDVVVGTGTEAKAGDNVTVNYLGTFDNGTKFDSSYDRKMPFSFVLGAGGVIKGWDAGVVGMKVGGKRNLTIPPELGYGPNDYQQIPGNSTLHFTIELLSVSSTKQ